MGKLWKLLLFILIIVIAVFFPAIIATIGNWISTLFTGVGLSEAALAALKLLPWWVGAAVAVGTAYLIDPETTQELASDIGGLVGSVGGAILGGAVTALTGGNLLLFAAAGLGLYLFLGRKKDKDEPPPAETDTAITGSGGLTEPTSKLEVAT